MQSDSIYASLLAKVPLCSQVSSMMDDLEQKYQQLITAKKWEGVGHVGMDNHNKSAFNATANQEDEAHSYAAYVNNKATQGFLKFDKWAKLQTCHHCGNKGHVCPNCRKYLAEKANGTLPPPGKKRLTRPAHAFNKYCREKLQRDLKLKALLSAFSAFTTKYLAYSQPVASETVADGDGHDNLASGAEDEDEINTFWAWWELKKNRQWSPWFPHSPYSKNDPRYDACFLCTYPCEYGFCMACLGFDSLFSLDISFYLLLFPLGPLACSSIGYSSWFICWFWQF
jgi:hypothetical protein